MGVGGLLLVIGAAVAIPPLNAAVISPFWFFFKVGFAGS